MEHIKRSYVMPSSIAGGLFLIAAGWLISRHGADFLRTVAPDRPVMNAQAMDALRIPFVQNGEGSFAASTFAGKVTATRAAISYALSAEGSSLSVTESFVGASHVVPAGATAAKTVVNVYRGNDRAQWKEGMKSFNDISYGALWAGVGMTLAAHGNTVEKIFTVDPHADPSAIRFGVAGASALSVAANGELVMALEGGEVTMTAPIAYQEIAGKRVSVPVSYDVIGMEYGFALGAYDASLPLIIDPAFASTYFGGSSYEDGEGAMDIPLAFDSDGNVYISGFTASDDIPVTDDSELNTDDYNQDLFLAKFNDDLTELLAATYIGGSGYEENGSFFMNDNDEIFFTGTTNYSNFPVGEETLYPHRGNNEAFLLALDDDLTILTGTFFGGDLNDYSYAISGHRAGTGTVLFIAGSTSSGGEDGEGNYPLPVPEGSFQSSMDADDGSAWDGFVARFTFDSDTDDFIHDATTYLAMPSDWTDVAQVAYAWGSGDVYIAGETYSDALNNATNYPEDAGYTNGYVGVLDAALSAFTGAYLGGDSYDEANDMAVVLDGEGDAGNVFVVGYTESDDFPVTDGTELDDDYGEDVFIAKMPADLSEISLATYVGGAGRENSPYVALDGEGAVFIAGMTTSNSSLEISDEAFDPTRSSDEGFVMKFSPLLVRLAGTYLGGGDGDYMRGIAFNDDGDLYVSGVTHSDNFPVAWNAFQVSHALDDYSSDAFVSRMDVSLAAVCGDGYISFRDDGEGGYVSGEECDDGNDDAGDGCSASCMVEEGYTCSRPGLSVCIATTECLDDKDAFDSVRFDGVCYAAFENSEETGTWDEARASCQALGGDLAVPSSVEINLAIDNLELDGWIGATDSETEGTFVWIDGVTFWEAEPTDGDHEYPGAVEGRYTNWNPGEPNNAASEEDENGEDCLEIYSNGMWNDLPCLAEQSYICAFEEASSSSSSSSAEEEEEQRGGGGGGRRGGGGGGSTMRSGATTGGATSGGSTSAAQRREPIKVQGENGTQVFRDVFTNDWFGTYVKKLVELRIFEGYKAPSGEPLGMYGPADNITLGQLAKVAAVLKKQEVRGNVTGDEWFVPYVNAAKEAKISIFLGRLDPKAPATRGAVVQAVLEALGIPLSEEGSSFSDVPANHPHAKAIATAKKLGIVSGDAGKETFRPNDPVNRAEVAKMVVEALGQK